MKNVDLIAKRYGFNDAVSLYQCALLLFAMHGGRPRRELGNALHKTPAPSLITVNLAKLTCKYTETLHDTRR